MTRKRLSVRKATALTLAATAAGSLVLTGGLAAKMAAGRDAALAPKAHASTPRSGDDDVAQTPAPASVTTRTS
jgi:hypothetical protein